MAVSTSCTSEFVSVAPVVLTEPEWRERARAHEARVRVWTDPHQARAGRGERHPVCDFLFTYYSHRPSWLRRWQPGPEVALLGGGVGEWLARPEYLRDGDAVVLGPLPETRRRYVTWLRDYLAATESRPAFFGCFGLHEWAMVYRQSPEEIRHRAYPLRFEADAVAAVVESQALRCTHFDAFRFFTPAARPLNRQSLTREGVIDHEQPGCLHANMDLYKWAYKLDAHVPSELVADCFALAWDVRELDMRASPYDLAALGYAPVKIETSEGRAEYERLQRGFAERARPLRSRLKALCERLLVS